MIKKDDLTRIETLINNKKIIYSNLLSDSFGINCVKIITEDKKKYVVKYYRKKNSKFNAIKSEADNLLYFNNLNQNYFPFVHNKNSNYLILSFIDNNSLKPDKIENDLLNAIVSIHKFKKKYYGFNFDTQIGGLKQDNTKSTNWVEFYREKRLGYIYDLINSSLPMEMSMNKKIEILLKKLDNFIPSSPQASLLHGDLWEGNILFKNKKFVGFIDPGTFYGHNELEIAYLTWFNPNFIKNGFLDEYNNIINIDKEYKKYEPIYQLYYSLLNVYLWDRKYIEDVERLLKKIKL